MKKCHKAIKVMVVIILFVFALSSSVLETNAQTNDFANLSQTAQMITIVKNPIKIQEIKDITLDAIANKSVLSNVPNNYLNYNEIKIGEVFVDKDTYTISSIPITSSNYNPISNLTLIIQDGEILTYSETLITKSRTNTVAISVFTDGMKIYEKITDIEYLSNSEVQKVIDKAQNLPLGNNIIQTRGIAEVALCLSSVLLIDLVVARIVATTCIGACAGGVVPLCVPCIAGVFAIGGANIGAVIACFKK